MSTSPHERYEVIERLDAGGMAEVFRGRAGSIQGYEKQVAIKRVLPNLAKNEKFVKMFLDEAKLSLRLNHANIVSVFDLGQSGDTYFIVMEFVDGANLKKVLDSVRASNSAVPVPIAVYIASKVCEGLQYAHEQRDMHGELLGLVHRDVSPPNVLVSWQGEVKITDFGLAKASTQVELTDPGVVKGKFGYLSPEAAHGEVVDHRTDVFATGIVLWEMLAGRRLFQGETDIDTLGLVRAAEIPSLRAINPRVPPQLEEIVRRSLAQRRSDRYASAREFGTQLMGYLFSAGRSVTPYDVAAYMKETVGDGAGANERSRNSTMTNAIQEEINRLIRIEASGATQAGTMSAGSFEDPRSWSELTSDDTGQVPAVRIKSGSPPHVPTGKYASRSVGGEAVVTAPTRVRTQAIRIKELSPSETPPPEVTVHTPVQPPAMSNPPPLPRPVATTGAHPPVDERAPDAAWMRIALPALVGVAALLVIYLIYMIFLSN